MKSGISLQDRWNILNSMGIIKLDDVNSGASITNIMTNAMEQKHDGKNIMIKTY